MSAFKKELVNEINRLRTNPRRFASTLKEYTKCFNDKVLHFPGNDSCITTEEGVDAYNEAIEYLIRAERREPLNPSKGLCRICNEYISKIKHIDDIESVDLDAIIKKYGSFKGSFSRAIDFGGERPENVIVYLVVCDGDKSRGQRNSLLNPEVKLVGVGTGKHDSFGYFSVIITCTEFHNKIDDDDNGFLDAQSLAIKVNEDEEEVDSADEVESIDKKEEIVVEDGKKKKKIKVIKTLKDGRKQIETTTVALDE